MLGKGRCNMSYDLEARGDERYSQFLPRKKINEIVRAMPFIIPNGPEGFILECGDSLNMEIDIELAQEDGDLVEEKTVTTCVNCIRFAVFSEYIDNLDEAILVAIKIGKAVGWPVYDLQTNEPAFVAAPVVQRKWWQIW